MWQDCISSTEGTLNQTPKNWKTIATIREKMRRGMIFGTKLVNWTAKTPHQTFFFPQKGKKSNYTKSERILLRQAYLIGGKGKRGTWCSWKDTCYMAVTVRFEQSLKAIPSLHAHSSKEEIHPQMQGSDFRQRVEV